jgi:hypothetical protein
VDWSESPGFTKHGNAGAVTAVLTGTAPSYKHGSRPYLDPGLQRLREQCDRATGLAGGWRKMSLCDARLRLPSQSKIPLGVEVDISAERMTLAHDAFEDLGGPRLLSHLDDAGEFYRFHRSGRHRNLNVGSHRAATRLTIEATGSSNLDDNAHFAECSGTATRRSGSPQSSGSSVRAGRPIRRHTRR